MALDKSHPIPLYYQLVELVKEQIRRGELKPGDQLLSERELSEQVGISRMTARQAIAYLMREGVVEVKPGVGTFVAEPKLAHNVLHLLGFTEEMMHKGERATSQVLAQELLIPPPYVAAALCLPAERVAVKIVRLRLSGPTPLLLETIFVPADLCPGLEQENLAEKSLYALLEQQYGFQLERTWQTLEATVANEYESELFGIAIGTPMILLEGVTYSERDRPMEYFKVIYRGDRFKFELESRRQAGLDETSGSPRISVVLA